MSRIGRAEVERIGHLARLRLEPDEALALARDLDAILAYVAELDAVETAGVRSDAGGRPRATPLRADRPAASLPTEQALANAPEADGSAFLVPAVLEDEDEG